MDTDAQTLECPDCGGTMYLRRAFVKTGPSPRLASYQCEECQMVRTVETDRRYPEDLGLQLQTYVAEPRWPGRFDYFLD
jgi:transposase-like protein